MSEQFFNRVAMATDLHWGNKHNSKQFNDDLSEFMDWFIAEAKKRDCETCVILGDWHHNRNTINVVTLNYTVENINKLSQNFEKVYIITGNHDLYYREKREMHSLPMGKSVKNVYIVDELLTENDVAIVPWLVEDEWKTITNLKTKYIFGHFELPGFKMNAMIEMPDHGGINRGHFLNQDYVFSGHFHKRQCEGNVHYIGNPFGHNYGDAGDTERGACFLEWGGTPEYVNYAEGPRYVVVDLSDLLDTPEKYLNSKSYVKVNLNIDISYEEASFLRETFISNYNVREFKLVPIKNEETYSSTDDIVFESVDQIVLSELNNIQSDMYKKDKLIEIYNNL